MIVLGTELASNFNVLAHSCWWVWWETKLKRYGWYYNSLTKCFVVEVWRNAVLFMHAMCWRGVSVKLT
jgi:hypothetical protein